MTISEAQSILHCPDAYGGIYGKKYGQALEVAFKCMEACEADTLDKIRAEIGMYEADCRLQGGTDACEKCNSNVFGSIYRIIDKYKAGEENNG